MRVKIKGGTASEDSASLCESCRWATIIRGPKLSDEIVSCGQIAARDSRIRFKVVSCTEFDDRRQPSLRNMEEIAWVLRSDERRKRIGFIPARSLKPSDRFVLDD